MNTPAPSAGFPRVTRRGARMDWIKFDSELSRDGSVDPVDKALYAAIASYADTETRETPEVDPGALPEDVPTRKRLAECIGRSVDTVDRATKRLEERGILRVHRQADATNPKRMLPSEYELLDHELWDQRAAERAARRAARHGQSADQDVPSHHGGGRTSAATPGRMDAATPGRTGAAVNRREKEVREEEGEAGADAVGQSDGGFARGGWDEGPEGERPSEPGGSAAQETIPTPRSPKRSPRPKTVKTQPRQMPPGFEDVRAAIPHRVARPGTQLYVGLRRAIADLLTGTGAAPRRTPEQVIARINRRWYGERAEERSAPGYRPVTDAEGDRPIKNPSSWLAAAILAQDCPDLSCEDGVLLGTGRACSACRERKAEEAAARRAAEEARALLVEQTAQAQDEAEVRQAYEQAAGAAEREIRERLARTGAYGALLEHRVDQAMTRWRLEHPAPPAVRSVAAGASR